MSAGKVSPEQLHYFQLQEQLQKVRHVRGLVEDRLERAFSSYQREKPTPATDVFHCLVCAGGSEGQRSMAERTFAAEDMATDFKDAVRQSQPIGDRVENGLLSLVGEASLLHLLRDDSALEYRDGVELTICPIGRRPWSDDDDDPMILVQRWLRRLLGCGLPVEISKNDDRGPIRVKGLAAQSLITAMGGTHLLLWGSAGFTPIRIETEEGPSTASTPPNNGPLSHPVSYVFNWEERGRELLSPVADLRTGSVLVNRDPSYLQRRVFLLTALAVPPVFLSGEGV